MCGIVGFAGIMSYEDCAIIERMVTSLRHRGPDDSAIWLDRENRLAIGHARLAILDLSLEGRQPMTSSSGRYRIVFNGEVYNFKEILASVESSIGQKVALRGHSDTEVMLAAFEAWGVEKALLTFRGMFAFVLWDCTEKVLWLCRDRLGVKPLYYGWCRDTFLFASELKALLKHPSFTPEVDRDALALYMRFNYILAPHTIYSGIYKLPQACLLRLKRDHLWVKPSNFSPFPDSSSICPSLYWDLKQVVERGLNQPFQGSKDECLSWLESLLSESVKLRMVADVPLGAFLSGGIDSSLVVALMQHHSSRPVRTFSIGFSEREYNEADYAKRVASHIGTEHTEMYISPAEAFEVVPLIAKIFDEPFSDSSQIPTYLVSKLARRSVTVSLSGDGGDELFGGYLRYPWAQITWRRLRLLPNFLRNLSAQIIKIPTVAQWDVLIGFLNRFSGGALNFHNPGDKAYKLADVLQVKSFEELYGRLVSHWEEPQLLVPGSTPQRCAMLESVPELKNLNPSALMMYLDMQSYLVDDILVKLDRTSMAVSLEAREPLLDHKLVEFAWTLPDHWKTSGTSTKKLLKELLFKYVPKQLVCRPKMGFGVPLDSWLRGPLRDWVEDLLDEKKLNEQGFLNAKLVRQYWEEHLSGMRNRHFYLWDVLMFQAWLKESG